MFALTGTVIDRTTVALWRGSEGDWEGIVSPRAHGTGVASGPAFRHR